MGITARELIAILQDENAKMREKLEFANKELSALFHALDRGEDVNVKDVIYFIGTNIESFLEKGE